MKEDLPTFWDNKRSGLDGVPDHPTPFALKVWPYIKENKVQTLLEIGSGKGADALFFTQNGVKVTATDISPLAVKNIKKYIPGIEAEAISATDLKFPDESFDAIYARLSVHYFKDKETSEIFENMHRMLKNGGLILIECKSTKDPEYGVGEKIEKDTYKAGYMKHFFSQDYFKEKAKRFEIIQLTEEMSQPKSPKKKAGLPI